MRTISMLAAVAVFLAPGAASAQAALRVQPLSVDVVSPSQASAITLQNNGPEQLSVQLRVFEWSQVDGQDRLVPTNDVVASPPVARIAPGSNYTVRIARTVGAAGTGAEKSYRLWIDELPPALPEEQEGGEVDVRLRFDLPVFFHAENASPALSWRAHKVGDDVVLEATNTGSGHARIQGLELHGGSNELSFGEGLNGYVLANSTRRWTAPAGSANVLGSGRTTVVTGTGDSETSQVVALAD